MKTFDLILRIVLALFLLFVGLNKFLQFMSMPPPSNEVSQAYMEGLAATGFFFRMLGLIYIVSAVLCLFNLFVPLVLVILSSVIFNILVYHFGMGEAGSSLFAIIFTVLVAALAWVRRKAFRPLFAVGTKLEG